MEEELGGQKMTVQKESPTFPPLQAIPSPSPPPVLSPEQVEFGNPIPPIERIRIYSSKQWEDFIFEWVDSLRQKYSEVNRCGGAGDMGRDVVAFVHNSNEWDNYQCKHYDQPLMPSDIWIELGKLMYYSHCGDYTYPRKYYFVAPQGAGTKLSNLLRDTDKLHQGLIDNWDKKCKTKITSTSNVNLSTELKQYINKANFSIFSVLSPLTIIAQHRMTPWYTARFGGDLPERPAPVPPPPDITSTELNYNYVSQLFKAYGDHLKSKILSISDLQPEYKLYQHFLRSRESFYSAESLKSFSKDHLPGTFERLQEQYYDGVIDTVEKPYDDGYARVIATIELAKQLNITDQPLQKRTSMKDKGGICHQLVNDQKMWWMPCLKTG
ncbi:MAG: hypothetical protein H7839_01130 [Magnetococcus sp. YQC-5]